MRPSVPDVHITESQDAEIVQYRPLAWQAVPGLIFGLVSPLSLLAAGLFVLPLLGVIFSHWALRRIRKYAPTMVGRNIAWAGMTLSLLFAVAVPADILTYRWMIRGEARQFTDLWFNYIALDEPQIAYQLSLPAQQRQPQSVRLWDHYRQAAKDRENLGKFTAIPAVRTLLAMGAGARIRFYDIVEQIHEDDNDQVNLIYAVTYEESGDRKSFFLNVFVLRSIVDNKADWRMTSIDGGIRPAGF
jgi:hypothetical protein